MLLPFPEYRPDVSDLNAGYTRDLLNCVPRGDGYGPFTDSGPFTGSLPAPARGGILAQLPDGTVSIFAGTETRLYKLNNTTLEWSDVSKGGSAYGSLGEDANWVFSQFGNIVTATQRGTVVQQFDVTSDSAFSDLGGSPPQAGHSSVIGPFLVLSDLLDNPNRVQWSGLNAIETWDGTNSSDFQDLADGGRAICTAFLGNDAGIILQQGGARRMAWAPGDERVFIIDRLENADGTIAPYSVVTAPGGAYFLSPRGFVKIDVAGTMTPIGEERVNRSFLGQHPTNVPQNVQDVAVNADSPQLIIGASDPDRSLVFWVYQSRDNAGTGFDRGLVYHTTLNRWAPIQISGDYLLKAAQPGLTLEALDAIAPGALTITDADDNGSGLIRLTVSSTSGLTSGNYYTVSEVTGTTEANGTWEITVIDGTTFDLVGSTFANAYVSGGVVGGSLDAMTLSLDSYATATLPALAVVDSDQKLGFFSGDTLECTLTTSEQSLGRTRIDVNELRPITDAATAYCRLLKRDNLNEAETEGTEILLNSDGICPTLEETRYARARFRVPAGEIWSFATGVEPEVMQGSEF